MDKPTCKTVECERPATQGDGTCKPCWHHDYYIRNREYLIEQTRAYRALHVDQAKVALAAYVVATPGYREARSEYNRRYREANRERLNASALVYAATHKDRAAELGKARRLANPFVDTELVGRRRARKNGTVPSNVDYAAILAEFGMVCHICGDDIPDRTDLHFDHVIPLSKGGAHSAENVRPSHSACNRKKGSHL